MSQPSESAPATAPAAAPAPTARRRPRRAPRIAAWTLAGALVLGGGYVAAAAWLPLPAPTLELSADQAETTQFADRSPAQAAVDAQALPTAIGWLGHDDVWSNDDTPRPIASISKLITVLVALETMPLTPDELDREYTWSAADAARTQEYLDVDGVAFEIPVGSTLTMRDMLTLIFLPSANDVAAAYAYSVFGDNDGFVAAVDDWTTRHGLDSVTLVEPTGLEEANVASPSDLVRVARHALAQPAVLEFTGMRSASLGWGIGDVDNTNLLLGELPDILGLKTGRSLSAGFNFVTAQRGTAGEREVVAISVTLGRGSVEERAQSGRDMLGLLAEMPATKRLVTAGEELGVLVGPDGARVPLVADADFDAVLLPGERTEREVSLDVDAAVSSAQSGDVGAGSVRVTTPDDMSFVPVRATGQLPEPDLWWRLTHPGALLAR